MGQLTPFRALPSVYPETIDALDPAESAFLIAVRWWVAARQQDDDPLFHLWVALDNAGAEAAAFPLDQFMSIAAHSTRRRVVTYCPHTPDLGEDEKQLLYSANLVQSGRNELALQLLQTTLLTIEGANIALVPLKEIGAQFVKSRLLFRRRKTPALGPSFPATVESWLSSRSASTLH